MHEVDYIGGDAGKLTGGAKLWMAGGLLAMVLVIFMQWFTGDVRSLTTAAVPAAVAHNETVEGGQYSDFAMTAKAAVKMRRSVKMTEADKEEAAADFAEGLVPLAVTRTERLRLAIVGGELVGREEALKWIDELQKELEPGSELGADAVWLKILYEKGREGITEEAQASLLERHEWFGKLAMAFGKPVGDQFRRAAVMGRERITSTFFALTVVQVIMFLVGILALVWTGVRLQEVKTEPDFISEPVSDHHLEAFILFCAGFVVVLGLSILPFGISAEGSMGAVVFSELLMWSLLFVPMYPLLRGVPWKKFCQSVGLHTGEGIVKEAAYGVVGFLAWMPLIVLMSYATDVIGLLGGASEVEGSPGGYPMFQQPPSDSGLVLFLSVVGSVMWAPLVEEIVFRGFLYGWLRQRVDFLGTVIIVSIAFGIIHPYSPLGMLQVAVGGVLFGILREWRGSLIAPMVAHALHNGQIEVSTLAILRAIGG